MGAKRVAIMNQQDLIEQYFAAFSKLDEMLADELLHPVAWQLASGDCDHQGFKRWRPAKLETEPSLLKKVYGQLPAPFPPLFERMVLSYRWAEVDLFSYRLLANPPGPNLMGLLNEISFASGLWEALIPAGFIQFGQGPGLDYDPVCFDTRSRSKSGDYRIVKIDHEGILCNYRVRIVDELAPSFEQLVVDTIQRGDSIRQV